MESFVLLVMGLVAAIQAVHLGFQRVRELRLGRRRSNTGTATRRLAYDPGLERRAERRARALLESVVNEDEWDMYCQLGFIRVEGPAASGGAPDYNYLIYPHKPIVAYMSEDLRLLNEYCVNFSYDSGGRGGARMPAADDVLAKWLAVTGDERLVIRRANMHLPGRQVDPGQVRRDISRLAEWGRRRNRQGIGEIATVDPGEVTTPGSSEVTTPSSGEVTTLSPGEVTA